MQLSDVIRKWRHMSELSVREAARRTGVEASTLNRIERGEEPSGRSLAKLVRWLLSDEKGTR